MVSAYPFWMPSQAMCSRGPPAAAAPSWGHLSPGQGPRRAKCRRRRMPRCCRWSPRYSRAPTGSWASVAFPSATPARASGSVSRPLTCCPWTLARAMASPTCRPPPRRSPWTLCGRLTRTGPTASSTWAGHPSYRWHQWSFSAFIAVSHGRDFSLWREGDYANPGVRAIVEDGSPFVALETVQGSPSTLGGTALGHPIRRHGWTRAVIRVTPDASLLSLISHIEPSPDWFVGAHDVSLCDASGHWRPHLNLQLVPFDAGLHRGDNFTGAHALLRTPDRIGRIPPTDARSPFYRGGAPLEPLAVLRVSLTRLLDGFVDGYRHMPLPLPLPYGLDSAVEAWARRGVTAGSSCVAAEEEVDGEMDVGQGAGEVNDSTVREDTPHKEPELSGDGDGVACERNSTGAGAAYGGTRSCGHGSGNGSGNGTRRRSRDGSWNDRSSSIGGDGGGGDVGRGGARGTRDDINDTLPPPKEIITGSPVVHEGGYDSMAGGGNGSMGEKAASNRSQAGAPQPPLAPVGTTHMPLRVGGLEGRTDGQDVGLGAAPASMCAGQATYEVTLVGLWDEGSHPGAVYPRGASFVGVTGASHTEAYSMFRVGSTASTGLQRLAVEGQRYQLLREIQQSPGTAAYSAQPSQPEPYGPAGGEGSGAYYGPATGGTSPSVPSGNATLATRVPQLGDAGSWVPGATFTMSRLPSPGACAVNVTLDGRFPLLSLVAGVGGLLPDDTRTARDNVGGSSDAGDSEGAWQAVTRVGAGFFVGLDSVRLCDPGGQWSLLQSYFLSPFDVGRRSHGKGWTQFVRPSSATMARAGALPGGGSSAHAAAPSRLPGTASHSRRRANVAGRDPGRRAGNGRSKVGTRTATGRSNDRRSSLTCGQICYDGESRSACLPPTEHPPNPVFFVSGDNPSSPFFRGGFEIGPVGMVNVRLLTVTLD
eukprot:jgi/Mesvir1/24017/Mv10760-RA.1